MSWIKDKIWLWVSRDNRDAKKCYEHKPNIKEDTPYKDKAWQNPNCCIMETATGKVLKNYGETIWKT